METISSKWDHRSVHAIDSPIIYYTYIVTPIGKVLLTARHDTLIGLHIEGQNHFPIIEDHWQHNAHIAILSNLKIQLNDFFTAKRRVFQMDYNLCGTAFQINVWNSLLKIPYGEVVTYKTFASLAAYPDAIRAVASVLGKNPLSILLPCHRVIRSDGSLGGYAAGIDIKKKLLRLEGGVSKCALDA